MQFEGADSTRFKTETVRLVLATFLAFIISALTIKTIALTAGPAGIGQVSIFRQLSSFLMLAIGLGFSEIITRQTAATADSNRFLEPIRDAIALTTLQSGMFIFLGIFAPLLAPFLLPDTLRIGLSCVYVILAMTFLNLALQNSMAILRADLNTTAQAIASLITAIGSLALILPLLQLGTLGLALSVGSGALLGLPFTLFVLHYRHRKILNQSILRPSQFGSMFSTSISSISLAGGQALIQGVLLWITTDVAQYSGMQMAGQLGAAMLVSEGLCQVVLSPGRTTTLARLARSKDSAEEANAFLYASRNLIVAAGGAASLVILTAPFLSIALFSRKFDDLPILITILATTLPLEAFAWTTNAAQIARGQFPLSAIFNGTYALLLLGISSIAWHFTSPNAIVACSCIATAKFLWAILYSLTKPSLPRNPLRIAFLYSATFTACSGSIYVGLTNYSALFALPVGLHSAWVLSRRRELIATQLRQ